MTLEMAILAPVFVLVMVFVAAAGRMIEAQGQVDGAARDAARAASVQRHSAEINGAVYQAAYGDLNPPGKDMCPGGMTSGGTPQAYVGTHATQVQANVVCRINLLILPAALPVTGHAVAPVDTFVQRDW